MHILHRYWPLVRHQVIDESGKVRRHEEYRTSPLFTDADRTALDYVTELTHDKNVNPEPPSSAWRQHYSERQVCEIVWLVASEHFYNMTNIGLNIPSDMLCDLGEPQDRKVNCA